MSGITRFESRIARFESLAKRILVDVSDIFYFLFGSGRGNGESEVPGGGIESPKGGGGSPRWEGPTGRKGVCSPSGDLEGGRLNIFFRGRNVHQGIARFELKIVKPEQRFEQFLALRFESCDLKIAAKRWRFESLRTANRDRGFKVAHGRAFGFFVCLEQRL